MLREEREREKEAHSFPILLHPPERVGMREVLVVSSFPTVRGGDVGTEVQRKKLESASSGLALGEKAN